MDRRGPTLTIVADASMAISYLMYDERDSSAIALFDHGAQHRILVPCHWGLEVANALVMSARRGRLDREGLVVARDLLTSLESRCTVDLALATDSVFDLCLSHGLSAYDAAYVELCRRHGAHLATLDRKLATAAASTSVPLWVA